MGLIGPIGFMGPMGLMPFFISECIEDMTHSRVLPGAIKYRRYFSLLQVRLLHFSTMCVIYS